jgi:hypothetical protein
MSLFPDTFANPGLWPLGLLALLPVILHILDRRRARRLEWPAMRFFLVRSRSRLRWMRFKEMLLIASRTAAILAFAYALLRPQTTVEVAARGDAGARRGVVLVVDTSFSMAYRHRAGGPSSLEKAKEAALEIAAGLRPGDLATLLAGGGELWEAAAAADPTEARRAALALELAGGSFDLLRAFDHGAAAASRVPAALREVYILTDLQASTVPLFDEARWKFLRSRLDELEPSPRLVLVDCGSEGAVNRRVTMLEAEDLLAGAGEPLRLRAAADTAGPLSAPLLARWFAGERSIAEQLLPAGGDGTARLELVHRFPASGPERLRLELEPDGLALDDTRYLALEVSERIDVLIVEDEGAAEGSGRFLELALLPRVPGIAGPEVIFRPRRRGRVDAAGLAGARVVVLAGVPRLSEAEAELIVEHVARGGGLVVFAGPRVDAALYNAALHRDGRGPLPARLIRRERAAAGSSWHPEEVVVSHPVLSPFSDPATGDLGRIRVSAFWRTGHWSAEARVLARLDRSAPWILEQAFERGRVALITTSAASDDSDFPLTPLFLPFIDRLVRHVAAGGRTELGIEAGEPLRVALDVPAATSASLVGPAGSLPLELSREDGRLIASSKATHQPGFYELEVLPEAGPPIRRLAAANIAPQESALERLDRATIEAITGLLRLEPPGPAALAAGGATRRIQTEHWPAALGAALAFLIAELALARSLGGGRARKGGL